MSVCTKCGEREAKAGQRWCARCRTGGERKGNVGVNAGDVHPDGVNGTVTTLRARVEELEGEVARLKKELAGRAGVPATVAVGTERIGVTKRLEARASGPLRANGPACIHGGVYGACRKLGCGVGG